MGYKDQIAIIAYTVKIPPQNNMGLNFMQGTKNLVSGVRKKDLDRILNQLTGLNKKYLNGYFFDRIDCFDPYIFHIPPKEAALMDPIQRIFLTSSAETISKAGYSFETIKNKNIGVYYATNFKRQIYSELVKIFEPDYYTISLSGNTVAMIPARVSYTFDIKGPALVIENVFDSSIKALHIASLSLLNNEIESAIVGTVNLNILPIETIAKNEITNEFSITVMVKSLQKAIEHRDHIYATIEFLHGSSNDDQGTLSIPYATNEIHLYTNRKSVQNNIIDRIEKLKKNRIELISNYYCDNKYKNEGLLCLINSIMSCKSKKSNITVLTDSVQFPINIKCYDNYQKINETSFKIKPERYWIDIAEPITEQQRHSLLIGRETGIYTSTEQKLADLWYELLGLPEFDVNTSFIEIGGDSIIAMKMTSSIMECFHLSVDVGHIYKYQTLSQMADYLDSLKTMDYTSEIPTQDSKNKTFYHTSSAQKRQYVLYKMNSKSIAYNILEAFKITGELDADKLENSLNLLFNLHEIFRTTYCIMDKQVMQKIHPNSKFKLRRIYVDYFCKDEIQSILESIEKPFDLENLPLVRGLLVCCKGKNEFYLFYAMHHSLMDGESMGILQRHLSMIYDNIIPQISYSYKDYAEWQYRYLNSPRYKIHKNYWLTVCRELDFSENKMLDQPRDFLWNISGRRLYEKVEIKISERIDFLVKKYSVTRYVIILAAYALQLSCDLSQEKVIVGSVMSDRDRIEWNNVVGMFVNPIVLCITVKKDIMICDYIRSVQNVVTQAMQHKSFPFEDLVETLALQRTPNRNPIFDFILNMQSDEDNTTTTSIQITALETKKNTSRCDLSVDCHFTKEGITFVIDYHDCVLKKETVTSFIRNFKNKLNSLTDPDKQSSTLQNI